MRRIVSIQMGSQTLLIQADWDWDKRLYFVCYLEVSVANRENFCGQQSALEPIGSDLDVVNINGSLLV